ncbi:PAPP5 [Symbiodinium sp. KB8]|nr:PAPP5 [Symbiodinium sp. KB8]
MAGPTQRKKSLRSFLVNPAMKARAKAATEARQEFCDNVALSDVLLVLIIVGFSMLGNMFPPRRRSELYIGVAAFLASFGVYVCVKSYENAKKREENAKENGAEPPNSAGSVPEKPPKAYIWKKAQEERNKSVIMESHIDMRHPANASIRVPDVIQAAGFNGTIATRPVTQLLRATRPNAAALAMQGPQGFWLREQRAAAARGTRSRVVAEPGTVGSVVLTRLQGSPPRSCFFALFAS